MMRDVQVMLACLHWVGLPARKIPYSVHGLMAEGDVAYCKFCGHRPIVKVRTHRWHIRCSHSPCHYSRWFGQDEGEARRAAAKHKTKGAEHSTNTVYDKVTPNGKGTYWL